MPPRFARPTSKTWPVATPSCLFYGAGDEAWKRAIDNELKKMAGYRGGKPLPAMYTYLAEPRTSDKEDLIDMEEPGLIDGLGGFAGGGDRQIHAGR